MRFAREPEDKQLIYPLARLNDLKSGKDFVYNDRFLGKGTDVESYIIEEHKRNLKNTNGKQFITWLKADRMTKDIPQWVEETKIAMDKIGAKFHETLSTAFNTRGITFLFHQVEDFYYVSISKDVTTYDYKTILACMMLYYNDDADFVRRSVTAIQDGTMLTVTKEEQMLLDKLALEARLAKITDAMSFMIAPKDYTYELDEVKDRIASTSDLLLQLLRKEKDLQLKQYANTVEEGTNAEVIEDFNDYLSSVADRILDIYSDNSNTIFTVETILRIPETDKDFFKPSSIAHYAHMLHDKPELTKMLVDVMNQVLRVPIMASYKLRKENGKLHSIVGSKDFRSSFATYDVTTKIRNIHVNDLSCFSRGKTEMTKAFNNNDYVGLVEIMMECSGTVNLFDGNATKMQLESMEALNRPNTLVQYKEDDKWNTITLEEYYEKVKD